MRNGSTCRPRWLPRLRRSFTPAPSDVGIESMTCSKVRVLIDVSIAILCASGRERRDLRGRLGETRLAAFGAHRQTLGIDELHIRHAEKSEKVAYVTGLGIERRARIEAAPGREHVNPLAREQTDRPGGRVLERHPGARNVVEIGF